MATNIFFSYSRVNSNFTLQLATKLSEAGENVWLDQFNIEAGEKWDNEIQKGLEEATTLVVILSASSVKSENVMDEVSYAIGKGKKVIPVLIEECEIPFRLRRFQYCNFTRGYQAGISMLIESLELDNKKRQHLLATGNEIDLSVQSMISPATKSYTFSSSKSPLVKLKNKKVFVAALSIVVIAVAALVIKSNTNKKELPHTPLGNNNTPKTEKNISPITFNVQDTGITLIYNSHTLNRKDTFKVSATNTIEELITALISHYKISPPKKLLDNYADENGGYRLTEVLWAEHKPVYSSGSLLEAGLKNYDVVEFHYELTNSRPMACPPQTVLVKINGTLSKDAVMYLNGSHSSDIFIQKDNSAQFYFERISECNPGSWYGHLSFTGDKYTLLNPEHTYAGDTVVVSFKMPEKDQ
jgi:hypothetical protein